MRKIISIIKEHKWAIILALLAALFIAAPQIYFRLDSDVYQGIDMMGTADETPYSARIREVQDGHLSLANPYLKEAKNEPYMMPPLGEIIVGGLGKIFGLDFKNTILFSRLFFSFLDFLLVYGFIYLLSRRKTAALAGSIAVLLGSIFLSQYALLLLRGQSPRLDFLIFSRLVIPPIHAAFFFGFLVSFWLFLQKKQWWAGAISSVLLGLSFYIYFYTWSFLLVFCGLLAFLFLLQKKWLELKRIVLVIAGAILVAAPYFVELYRVSSNPAYVEMSQRFGFVASRDPVFGFLIIPLLIIFLLFFSKQRKERFIFSLALLLTPFIVLNQQIITGRVLINAHYHWYCHTPLAVIFFIIILFELVDKLNKKYLAAGLAALIIFASFYAGFLVQRDSYLFNKKEAQESQKYSQSISWLNQNARKDQAVFADEKLSSLIVAYTPLNVFYYSAAIYYLGTTEERLRDALFSFYRLNGLKTEDAQATFFKERAEVSSLIYAMYYRETTGDYGGIPDAVLVGLVQEYKGALSIPPEKYYKDLWQKYNVDYVVWDKAQEPQWQLDQYSFLRPMYQNNDIIIYETSK